MASFRCELTAYFDLATKFVAGLPSRSLLERREEVLKAVRLRLLRRGSLRFLRCAKSEGWRRGELNPCPRRYPRRHLHVYPAMSFKEPDVAPAHCPLPSAREIDSQIGAVAPPICQPAVLVFDASRRRIGNVAVN